MQINLPEDFDALIQQRAAAAGFEGEIGAYVAHLVQADETEDYQAPGHLSAGSASRLELDSMIDEGINSGAASSMTNSDWQELHDRIDSRRSNS